MSNGQFYTNNRDIARALCSLHRTLLNRGHGFSDLRKTKEKTPTKKGSAAGYSDLRKTKKKTPTKKGRVVFYEK
jgi:hypothetical protein